MDWSPDGSTLNARARPDSADSAGGALLDMPPTATSSRARRAVASSSSSPSVPNDPTYEACLAKLSIDPVKDDSTYEAPTCPRLSNEPRSVATASRPAMRSADDAPAANTLRGALTQRGEVCDLFLHEETCHSSTLATFAACSPSELLLLSQRRSFLIHRGAILCDVYV